MLLAHPWVLGGSFPSLVEAMVTLPYMLHIFSIRGTARMGTSGKVLESIGKYNHKYHIFYLKTEKQFNI